MTMNPSSRSVWIRTAVVLALLGISAHAGEISYTLITNDADSGISAENTYTHTLDFGTGSPGALINGVQFDAYNNAANGTLNFNREAITGLTSDHAGNAAHNVSGSLADLLTDMYYNGNNAADGATTWTLSGLTPGKAYYTRIYTRQWGAGGTRHVTFVFDPDGAGPIADSTVKINEDDATSVGLANDNDAYYINYQFTAVAGEDLVITATQEIYNNSWHLYGLTNQEFSPQFSYSPIPEDGATDVLRDVNLSWSPGIHAVGHDVYLGESFDDVDTATVPTAPGLDVTSYDPGRLELDKTYFWRVDEVNAAPDSTIFKGDVWSFTVEPKALPVTSITATASSFTGPQEPINTVNGSGLTEADEHGITLETMWLSDAGDATPWIQFEFEQSEKLDKVHVWNHNSQTEMILGFGIKEALIETSPDGESWVDLKTVVLDQATAIDTYTGVDVALDGVVARFVRVTPLSNYSILGLAQFGLSEVRFYRIPNRPRELQPADGSTTDGVDVVMSWRAGREAAEHEIYLGTDPGNLALVDTVGASTYLAEALDYASTYYWQVVEVNEAETPAHYEGEILSFTTPEHAVIDDFEMYADEEGLWIWTFWTDGFENPDNGSVVGNGNIGERTVVYEGSQSMPIQYNNSNAPLSEVTLQIDDENWLASGIKTLSLMVFGNPDNTGQLYVKINDTQVVYDGDTPYLQEAQWLPWNIDLAAVGGNLANVTSLTIGVDGANAAGKLHIDSINLYPQVLPESMAPVFSYVGVTGDEDCGITADNTYTHALDFGTGAPGALINGVQFDAYNNAANGTLNFNRDVSSGALSDHAGNAAHNVIGGLADLLTDMYYNNATAPGGTTTWTLSGLTAGQTYQTRIYTRQWGATEDRNATFVFDPDGAGPISDSTGRVSQDNAMSVGFDNDNDAYYISYPFTAVAGEDLVITLTQHISTYSWHLYGLTNQESALE